LRYAPTAAADWRNERSGTTLVASESRLDAASSVDLAVFQRDGEPAPGPQYAVVTVMADEVHSSQRPPAASQGSM
jgi:hypothetical protein